MTRGLCVRCGTGPRTEGTYLCQACKYDPATRREMARAAGITGHDGLEQRRVLIARYHWAGEWPRVH